MDFDAGWDHVSMVSDQRYSLYRLIRLQYVHVYFVYKGI